jgi:hypothetical protein
MKRLSNADLRRLYIRRASLPSLLESVGLRARASVEYDPNCLDLVERINAIRGEIRDIVEDSGFDVQVPQAAEIEDRPHRISLDLTLASVRTAGISLSQYVDALLQVYLAPKATELEENPCKVAQVFIGHGSNGVVWPKVKQFIQDRCGLEPIVLELRPNSGLTVIEKLERDGRLADYAVFVMTGDDKTEDGEARARQNVIQELGWFQGVLGRGHTAILVQRGIEIPSNISGIVRLEFSGDEVEATFDRLRQELETTGLVEVGQRPPAARRRG